MADDGGTGGTGPSPDRPGTGERPSPEGERPGELIEAVPLRRPGRWIAAVIIAVLVFLFVWGAATNKNYQWNTYGSYLFDKRIEHGAWVTIQLTVYAMALGIGLGILLAVMRLSPNPVLKATSWGYISLFRGTPVYVQLVFWGLFTSLYPHIAIGIPFVYQVAHFDVQTIQAAFFFAFLGLGLNEGAYMSEIVRAGVSSVDTGQSEAAIALGMSWTQTMRRIVLPQAMRVIIPPTGNEVISMLKTTSLVTAVPLTIDLYSTARQISGANFRPIPLLLVASTWYLAMTSVLTVGQFYLERYYGRGQSRQLTQRQLRAIFKAEAEQHGAGAR